jgi:benzodiazapine receptor
MTSRPADTTTTSTSTPQQQQSKLQTVNYANVVAYVLNVGVTYGVGVSGLFPTNSELSAKYQTLVTPAGYAFSIWGIIFISQLIWVICQLLARFRSKDLVVKGVGYYYVAVCVAQILWTVFFSAELIEASFGAMVSILIPLVIILVRISKIAIAEESIGLYWLLKFPFEVHAGWIMAATLVNANVVLVARNLEAGVQVWSAWISLGSLALSALYFTCQQRWVIPCVLAWASLAIAAELNNEPRDSIVETFEAETIEHVKLAAGGVGISVLVAALGSFLYARFCRRGGRNTATATESQGDDAYSSM